MKIEIRKLESKYNRKHSLYIGAQNKAKLAADVKRARKKQAAYSDWMKAHVCPRNKTNWRSQRLRAHFPCGAHRQEEYSRVLYNTYCFSLFLIMTAWQHKWCVSNETISMLLRLDWNVVQEGLSDSRFWFGLSINLGQYDVMDCPNKWRYISNRMHLTEKIVCYRIYLAQRTAASRSIDWTVRQGGHCTLSETWRDQTCLFQKRFKCL